VLAPHSLLGLSPRYARCGIPQNFPCREILVEVGGIAPPSLNNQIRAATCLVYLLRLFFGTPLNKITEAAAFLTSYPDTKGGHPDQPKLTAQFQPLGRPD